jgi:hypothetical protein
MNMMDNLSLADEYIRAFFNARDSFAKYWCSIRGYDINKLTPEQQLELQNHHDYARPSIEILPYGHLTQGDEAILRTYSTGVDCAIELGTLFGRGAAVLSKQAKYVVTIDDCSDVNYGGMYHTIDTVRYRLNNYRNVMPLCRSTHESAMFVRETLDNKFQLLFIDADHSYEGVKKDFEHWYPLMELESFILFHDCNKFHPGVVEYLASNEFKKYGMMFIEQGNEGEGSISVWMKGK